MVVLLKGMLQLIPQGLLVSLFLEKLGKEKKCLSGYINLGEVIEVEVEHTYLDSTAVKILELTLNATNNKAKTETFVSKIASYYTPIVLVMATLIGTFLPLVADVSYSDSLYRALTFLVISCPCAIAISVPLSYFAGIGISSHKKILVKGSNYLDALTHCDTIIFDKTGTLTTGSLVLEEVKSYHNQFTKEKIIELASVGETFSNHPIARTNFKRKSSNIRSYLKF